MESFRERENELAFGGSGERVICRHKPAAKRRAGTLAQTLGENELMPYTRNHYTEEELYDKILREFVQIGQYESYLEDIEQKSVNMSSAIFSDENSFAYRNGARTPAAFEKLHGFGAVRRCLRWCDFCDAGRVY